MKQFKEIVLGIFIILFFGWLITFIYRQESGKQNRELAKQISELSPRGGPPQDIDDLKKAIALYEDQIERNVREGAQTGVYWKILATRLADKKMHQDALDALEKAIYYNAEDPVLFYLTGVSAGYVAKSIVGFSVNAEAERTHFYNLSENSYLRALELDPTYAKALYGLGVLYVYELDRPQDAIPYLERFTQLQISNTDGLFVLAAAHYLCEDYNSAMETYERIASRTKNKKIREEAMNNRDIIQGMLYE